MRLIKAQTTNLRSIVGRGVKYDINDQVVLESTNVVLLPKGTTAERPLSPNNGHARYNTDVDDLMILKDNGNGYYVRSKSYLSTQADKVFNLDYSELEYLYCAYKAILEGKESKNA